MMKKSDFNYDLPQELIAQEPSYPRDHSRLLHYDIKNKTILDKHFYDLADILRSGDVLVINNTKVLPARLYGIKTSTGAKVEILLLERINYTDFNVLAKPSKRLKICTEICFSKDLKLEVIGEGEEGKMTMRFSFNGVFEDILDKVGEMPLPHYIHKMPSDPARYQTVYAAHNGSSAAPTAGLHFTPELLKKLDQKGVEVARVLLHVGLGTFRPVKEDDILKHKMHSEYYEIAAETAEIINRAKRDKRRVVAVGTTCVRVLESVATDDGFVQAKKGNTNIFIYPPYRFKVIDAMVTNFHLPESTLIMLVSAFIGHKETFDLYKYAIEQRYKFFSFGDATIMI